MAGPKYLQEFDFPQDFGFTGSAGVQHVKGYARGGKPKVAKVMREFKEGSLRSGSKKGPKVTDRKQAVAIALSEAGLSKKAAKGGEVKEEKAEAGHPDSERMEKMHARHHGKGFRSKPMFGD